MVESEEQSLLSECLWVEKLAAVGMPLLNRWEEHRELIEAGRAGEGEAYQAFWPGRWKRPIGRMEPTPKGAGYSLVFPEEVTIRQGGRVVLLPEKPNCT